MMPGTYALSIYAGDDHAWRFVLWADVEKTEPADLTGMAVAAEIRERSSGVIIVSAHVAVTLPNIVDVSLAPADTRACPSSGRWDLQLTDVAGRVATVLAGPVKVTGDITDSTLAGARAAARTRGFLTEPAP
jgi:hypothetical protein